MMRDERYQSIKPLFLKNKIQTFQDIFTVVPKSIIASDLGKENDRFMELTNQVGSFTVQEIVLIGSFGNLTLSEMFTLIGREYPAAQPNKNKDMRYEIVRTNFDNERIHTFGDIFNYIPMSRVAEDIRKNRSRLSKAIKTQIKNLPLEPLVTIGALCSLTVDETLRLVEAQYQQQKQTITIAK
ncbi:MAG: hypothetical protein JST68_27395 [Bacteroidetes bacterium]|nr:hypothetical protein [Bacteroidota bacterium]